MRWWMKLAALLALLALLAWLGYAMVAGLVGMLNGTDMGAGERDPMFAEEPERIERPASLDAEEPPPDRPTLDDYVPEVQSPVEQTIDELIREAEAAEQAASQAPNHTKNAAK